MAEQGWAERDPLARMTARALEEGWIEPGTAASIERDAAAEIEEAVRFGRDSPFPDPDIANTLVYAA